MILLNESLLLPQIIANFESIWSALLFKGNKWKLRIMKVEVIGLWLLNRLCQQMPELTFSTWSFRRKLIHRQTINWQLKKQICQIKAFLSPLISDLILHVNATTANLKCNLTIWATIWTTLSSISPSLNCEGERLESTLNSIQSFQNTVHSQVFSQAVWPFKSLQNGSQLTREICNVVCYTWGHFAQRGSSFAATLSKAMLTKQFTKSHVLLDKDTHWTMSLLKWHQSVDTTNKYRLLANNFLHKLLPLAQLYYANRKSGLIVTLNNFKWSIWSIFIHTALTVEVFEAIRL